MSGGEVLRLKPGETATRIAGGEMQVVTTAPEPKRVGDPMVERAREILGRDFLGVDAVRNLEAKLNSVGQRVEFAIPEVPPIPYTEKDLELARQNGEMLVLRASEMVLEPEADIDEPIANLGRRNPQLYPVTQISFRELFRTDPLGKLNTLFYSFRPSADDWYRNEDFATRAGEIKLSWALVTKEVLAGSTDENHEQQTAVIKKHADELVKLGASRTDFRRRTPTEVVWDTLLYYVNNGIQLLPDKVDWTNTQSASGYLVGVGDFDSGGVDVDDWDPDDSGDNIGVCLSR